MSSEPPSDTSQGQDEGLDAEPSGHDADGGHGADGRKRWWMSVAAIAGVLAVAWGLAAFLFFSSRPDTFPDTRDEQTSPRQGLACPYLRLAAEAYERGDRPTFDRTIARAATIAEDTLQESGQAFGEPERIALELDLGAEQRLPSLLGSVDSACSNVGQ
jgi:hypothetical protein